MKMPAHLLRMLEENPDMLILPLESIHGWRTSPDEGNHTHCCSCGRTIFPGDLVVGCYLEYISTVFCPACVDDNPELFREWLEDA
jgi:hypothetical protein